MGAKTHLLAIPPCLRESEPRFRGDHRAMLAECQLLSQPHARKSCFFGSASDFHKCPHIRYLLARIR